VLPVITLLAMVSGPQFWMPPPLLPGFPSPKESVPTPSGARPPVMVTSLRVRSPQLTMIRNWGAFCARPIVAWLPLIVSFSSMVGSPAPHVVSAAVVSV
jgi:hypothetical protein